MKKLIRYLVNTILFVVIFSIPTIFIMGYAVSQHGTRPNALSAFGPIFGLLIAYILVKRINKSKLWARLFDEVETANDAVEEKKVEVEKEESYNWKLISIVALVLVAIMVISNTFFFPEVEVNTDDKIEDPIISKERDLLAEAESAFNNQNTRRRLKSYSTNETNGDNYVERTGVIQVGKGILTFKSTNQPVTGIVYDKRDNGKLYYSASFKDGVLDGISKIYGSKPGSLSFYYYDMGAFIRNESFRDGKISRIYSYPTGSGDPNGTTIISYYTNGVLFKKDSVVDGVHYITKY